MNNISRSNIKHNNKYVITNVDYYGTKAKIGISTAYILSNFKRGYYGDSRHNATTQD